VLPECQFYELERAACNILKLAHEVIPLLPPTRLLDQVSKSQNPVRVVCVARDNRRLAKITPSMLSQIEWTGKPGSTKTFKTIADALSASLDLIFPDCLIITQTFEHNIITLARYSP